VNRPKALVDADQFDGGRRALRAAHKAPQLRKTKPPNVIPAKAGIQGRPDVRWLLDPRFRGDDDNPYMVGRAKPGHDA